MISQNYYRSICQTLLILASASPVGCSSDADGGTAVSTGSLRVLLQAEDTITGGLAPGDEEESIDDGWAVNFNHFVVAIGKIEVHEADDTKTVKRDNAVFAVDLTKVPEAGLPLWELDELAVGRWSFNYVIGNSAKAKRNSTVPEAVFEDLVSNDSTYFIEGDITKPDGASCPPPRLADLGETSSSSSNGKGVECYLNPSIHFGFRIKAATTFGPCERDGAEGFAISEGKRQTVAATIHGDHMFFNGFPEGDESGVMRLVQWLADCDLNLDGEVTQAELEAIDPAALSELDSERYQLGGSPITPLTSMWDYVTAQVKTQGHFQGEGECLVDGLEL